MKDYYKLLYYLLIPFVAVIIYLIFESTAFSEVISPCSPFLQKVAKVLILFTGLYILSILIYQKTKARVINKKKFRQDPDKDPDKDPDEDFN